MGVEMTDELLNRYDRQVRLWGEHGQKSIGQTSVAVIGSSALATEILKSLILAGIESYKIFDDALVQESDTGNNFFVSRDDLHKQRAEVVTNYLNELNPSVKGSCTCRSFNVGSSLSVLTNFSLVVGVRISMDIAEYVGSYLYQQNIPFVWTTNVGLIGYFRLSYREHEILHDHRELPPHDFRLHKPFQSFVDFVNGFDLENMKHEQHSHVPYVVLLYKTLQAWREKIGNPEALPLEFKLRKEFIGILMGMQKLNDQGIYNEGNFEEAKQQVIKSFSGIELNENVKRLFADPRSNPDSFASENSSVFWVYVSTIKHFYEQHGYLPLSGILPDMTSDTNTYTSLVNLFREQAVVEAEEVHKYVSCLLNLDKFKDVEISFSDTVNYCKNFSRLSAVTGSNLTYEITNGIQNVFVEIAKYLESNNQPLMENGFSQEHFNSQGNGHSQGNGDCTPKINEICPLVWLVLLRASEHFYKSKNRFPGTNGVPCKIDAKDLLDRVKLLVKETGDQRLINNVSKLVPDFAIEEICRYGNSELNVVSSILGGVIAQEIIKLCTQQYVPVENTFVFDGNTQQSTMVFARIINGTANGLRRILMPPTTVVEQSNGLKVRLFLKLRCQHCYFIRINGRMNVQCTKSPRHKQCEPFNPKLLWY